MSSAAIMVISSLITSSLIVPSTAITRRCRIAHAGCSVGHENLCNGSLHPHGWMQINYGKTHWAQALVPAGLKLDVKRADSSDEDVVCSSACDNGELKTAVAPGTGQTAGERARWNHRRGNA